MLVYVCVISTAAAFGSVVVVHNYAEVRSADLGGEMEVLHRVVAGQLAGDGALLGFVQDQLAGVHICHETVTAVAIATDESTFGKVTCGFGFGHRGNHSTDGCSDGGGSEDRTDDRNP